MCPFILTLPTVSCIQVAELRNRSVEPFAYRFDRTHFTSELQVCNTSLFASHHQGTPNSYLLACNVLLTVAKELTAGNRLSLAPLRGTIQQA
jgi:hypothetical protein